MGVRTEERRPLLFSFRSLARPKYREIPPYFFSSSARLEKTFAKISRLVGEMLMGESAYLNERRSCAIGKRFPYFLRLHVRTFPLQPTAVLSALKMFPRPRG